MIGRTHGMHAEPITFGLKCAGWYAECAAQPRAPAPARARQIAFGKLSGAVGTFAQRRRPAVEAYVLRAPRASPEPLATQVVPRDRHARVLRARWRSSGPACERIALEIRHLQRTEVRRGGEPFGARPEGLVGDAAQAQPDPRRER